MDSVDYKEKLLHNHRRIEPVTAEQRERAESADVPLTDLQVAMGHLDLAFVEACELVLSE